ncbi:uncharacterized protein [Tenebrio molitor]|uniref:uncharacterized protein n=1 Tax=Tenebrio molitor TaxID=7067 RepID=UPI0036248D87
MAEEQVSLAKPVTNNLSKLLSEIESSLFFLKDTVDLINDIFGWPLALIISYTTVYILNNLDFVFQGSLNPDDTIAFKILADTILVLLTFAGTSVVIITCDLILREAETMLTKSYVLRRHTEMLSPKEKEKLIQFSDYRHLNHILQQQISSAKLVTNNLSKLLSEIESSLFFQKDTVDLINDIFGWPLALIISYTTLYILNNLDFVFQNSLIPDDKIAFKILADTILVLLTFTGTSVVIITCDLILRETETMLTKSYVLRRHTEMLSPKEKEKLIQFSDKKEILSLIFSLQYHTVTVIFSCDLVLKEAEEMLLKSYKLRRKTEHLSANDRKELKRFSNAIVQNFPKFSAQRFFDIDRSTILSILGTVITFFIIMVQFQDCSK